MIRHVSIIQVRSCPIQHTHPLYTAMYHRILYVITALQEKTASDLYLGLLKGCASVLLERVSAFKFRRQGL